MTIYYVDFESGNDANSGQTFATRWKSFANATTSTVLPGDTIRVKAGPPAVSTGLNAQWTNASRTTTAKYITSMTVGSPNICTIVNHGYSTGDTVQITGSTLVTGVLGVWEITVIDSNTFSLDGSSGTGTYSINTALALNVSAKRIMLSSAVTANIASTGNRWTTTWTVAAGSGATLSLSSGGKEGLYYDRITVPTAFNTGKIAYSTLSSTLDLSAYTQISFFFNCSTNVAAGNITIALCSDTTGDVPVNTFALPAQLNTVYFNPYTINNGTALGSSISSIAIYINTDLTPAATSIAINVSNFIACKSPSSSDCLTLNMLLGKSSNISDQFWSIQSINGRRVFLDLFGASLSANWYGYIGTSETVPLYTLIAPVIPSSAATNVTTSGNTSARVSIIGGWDRNTMSSITGVTHLDGQMSFNGVMAANGAASYLTIQNFVFSKCPSGIRLDTTSTYSYSSSNITAQNVSLICCNYGIYQYHASFYDIAFNYVIQTSFAVWSGNYGTVHNSRYQGNIFASNYGFYLRDAASSTVVENTYMSGIYAYCVYVVGNHNSLKVRNCIFDNSNTAIYSTSYANPVIDRCLMNTAFEVSSIIGATAGAWIQSLNHGQVNGFHKSFTSNGSIETAIDDRNTPSGYSWKLINNTSYTSIFPLIYDLVTIPFFSGSLVTVSVWMKRSTSSIYPSIVCNKNQIAGVTTKVSSAPMTTTNQWEQVQLSFTPQEKSAAMIRLEVYGASGFVWIDDLNVSQA